MRLKMLGENDFVAGVFIGGMEGVENEFKLFRELNPKALVLPIASTGAAARIIYDENVIELSNEKLENNYGYMNLFQELLIEKIN